jgi:hypothetical protein
MAFSDLEKIMYSYIVGRALPKGTTRMGAKALLAAAVQTGRALSPYAVRAGPPLARAAVNPYVGVPLAAATGTYMLQEELERAGVQEDVNVARDKFLASLQPTAVKAKKRVRSTYNRAVSKAMKAVKASTKGGPKGTISNAKKTFGTVSKAVSKARKGGKLSPKGVTGVVKRAVSGIFKPKAKRRTSTKGSYTITTRKP